MKGDVIILKQWHLDAAQSLVPKILPMIEKSPGRFVITVAGESGSGKSETATALMNGLQEHHIMAVILGQDDYFLLPPKQNTARRKADPDWLGPRAELNFDALEQNVSDAKLGCSSITKPLVDYDQDQVLSERLQLDGIKVLIAEGTYTSLLRDADLRIFIDRNWANTRADRLQRNRGNEVRDPFTEQILATEHKIIAGHKFLADFVITETYDLINMHERDDLAACQ